MAVKRKKRKKTKDAVLWKDSVLQAKAKAEKHEKQTKAYKNRVKRGY